MPLATVLVVEDDAAIRRGVVDALKYAGYTAREAADGAAGLIAATAGGVDLLLLDLLMPKLDGLSLLRQLRGSGSTLPVIILTARGEEQDRVKGLREGADDYVVKPFGATELLARVEAVLRRSAERPRPLRELRCGGCTVSFERREVVREDGSREPVPEREVALLEYLAANRARAVSRDELLTRVWGIDPRGVQTRTVDMAVVRVRELVGDDPGEPRFIITVRGKGYMLGPAAGGPA